MALNQVALMGRITHDLELKTSQSGANYINFSIAIDRNYNKNREERQTDFIPISAFGKQAEFVEKYLHKGTKVVISGAMNLDRQLKDGKTITYPKINVREIEFAESKKDNESKAENKGNDFLNIPDGLVDELPFS